MFFNNKKSIPAAPSGGKSIRESVRDAKREAKVNEESNRRQYYRTVPQKHYREMSGRQAKVLIEQSARYGIPFGGAAIDLFEVLRKFHDLLAKYSHVFGAEDDALLSGGGDSPNLERLRLASACLKEMDLEERRGTHVPLAEISPELMRLAGNIKLACEDVRRQWGNEPADRIMDAVEETRQGWLKAVGDRDTQRENEITVERGGGDSVAPPSQPS